MARRWSVASEANAQYLECNFKRNSPAVVLRPFAIHRVPRFILVAALLLSLTHIGCSRAPELFPVDGMVNLGDTPLDRGTIVFRPKNSEAFELRLAVVDGRFAATAERGVEAGEYDVMIVRPEPELEEVAQAMEKGERSPLVGMTVPERYAQPGTLTTTVGPHSGRSLIFDLDQR